MVGLTDKRQFVVNYLLTQIGLPNEYRSNLAEIVYPPRIRENDPAVLNTLEWNKIAQLLMLSWKKVKISLPDGVSMKDIVSLHKTCSKAGAGTVVRIAPNQKIEIRVQTLLHPTPEPDYIGLSLIQWDGGEGKWISHWKEREFDVERVSAYLGYGVHLYAHNVAMELADAAPARHPAVVSPIVEKFRKTYKEFNAEISDADRIEYALSNVISPRRKSLTQYVRAIEAHPLE